MWRATPSHETGTLDGDCESLAIRAKKEPDVWTPFNPGAPGLGGAPLGQTKNADPGAPGLLLAGYEGMKQRDAKIPVEGKIRLPEALDRLIDLYTATDKPEEVQKWQAERAKYPAPAAPATEKK